jgi:hypothetical protein
MVSTVASACVAAGVSRDAISEIMRFIASTPLSVLMIEIVGVSLA